MLISKVPKCKTREGSSLLTSPCMEPRTPQRTQGKGRAWPSCVVRVGLQGWPKEGRRGGRTTCSTSQPAVAGTGGVGVSPDRSRAAATAPRETAHPPPAPPGGFGGLLLVSGSRPCMAAVAPIPRGCCLPGLEDLIPHSPTFLPRGKGPLAQSIPLQALDP